MRAGPLLGGEHDDRSRSRGEKRTHALSKGKKKHENNQEFGKGTARAISCGGMGTSGEKKNL